MGVGQFCTKPGLVFGLGSPEFEQFAESFAKAMSEAPPATMLHDGICRAFHDGLDAMGKVPGVVELASGGEEIDAKKTQGEPTVFATDAENFIARRPLHEEVFG